MDNGAAVMMDETKLKALALKLFHINAFKFGDFKMKVGINSPVYFDLRVIVSYPDVMDTLADLLTEFIQRTAEIETATQHLCGVPYTALPLATLISIKSSKPMLIRRKEAKKYGTRKLIEGKFNAGDKCLIIEDVVTSGSSILETVEDLRTEGLLVTDAIVVVDREQGGPRNTVEKGVRMHSLYTLSYLLQVLHEAGKIEEGTVKSVAKYIECCQIRSDGSFVTNGTAIVNELCRSGMTFEARADLAKCDISRQLLMLMATKKTTLCVAADISTAAAILSLADAVGPYICLLKTHADLVDDFSAQFVQSLQALAKKHNFLLLEDRKFADIGNTVAQQYGGGPFRIADWADLVTVHSLPGQGILKGLKSVLVGGNEPTSKKARAVFLLAEMSSQGNLIDEKYADATMRMASETDVDFVAGVVCQSKDLVAFPGLVQLTPGVRLEEGTDSFGQRYNSPDHVVNAKGADVCVVGRGILNSKNPAETAQLYRDKLWEAYCVRVGRK